MILKGILFERAASELYLMKNKQKNLSDRQMLYVDFLCKELKLPLQIIAYVMESIDLRFLDQQGTLAMRRMILNIQEMVLYLLAIFLFRNTIFNFMSKTFI
jgi:hypothetical protein